MTCSTCGRSQITYCQPPRHNSCGALRSPCTLQGLRRPHTSGRISEICQKATISSCRSVRRVPDTLAAPSQQHLSAHQSQEVSYAVDERCWTPPSAIAAVLLLMCGVGSALPAHAASLGSQQPILDLAAELSPRNAALLANVTQPVLSLGIFLMLVRIVMSWYPNVKGDKLPWAAALLPTEFFLSPTRRAVPPVGGVDVAPIIWLAILTFLNEILLGPQGILNLLQRKLEI